VFYNDAQRFEYGAFGILKHQPIKPLYISLIVTMFKISTIRQMTYIFCVCPACAAVHPHPKLLKKFENTNNL
jgi:hypothetical protein